MRSSSVPKFAVSEFLFFQMSKKLYKLDFHGSKTIAINKENLCLKELNVQRLGFPSF